MEEVLYTYQAEVVRIIDGDSIVLKVDMGFRMTTTQSFRLYGIDTPELRSRDEGERAKAQVAKARLIDLCPIGSIVWLVTYKADKYGRWLADIIIRDDRKVNEILVTEGHAKVYHGGKR